MRRMTLLVLAAATLMAGCRSMESSRAMAPPSLYERLGGKPAITAVVDDFVGNVAADNRINHRFGGTNLPRLKAMLVDQICQASGGPCTYAGRTMRDAHTGMNITDAEFTALVEDLVKSLDTFKVPAREKNELLAALGGMKPEIVGK